MLGLCASVLIYFTAPDEANEELERMRSTKMYMHEIEHFGGKMAVLFEEISQWLGSLWHGPRLALTVAWLSLASAVVLFLIARLHEDEKDS